MERERKKTIKSRRVGVILIKYIDKPIGMMDGPSVLDKKESE